MLKIRLQGTTRDIKWFLKLLGRDRRFMMNKPSEIMPIKGSERFKRAYTELFRDKEEYHAYKSPNQTDTLEIYCGSGRRYSA